MAKQTQKETAKKAADQDAQKETAKKAADQDAEKSTQEDENDDEPLKKYTDGPTITYPVPDADPQPQPETPEFVPAIDDPDKEDNSLDSEDEQK